MGLCLALSRHTGKPANPRTSDEHAIARAWNLAFFDAHRQDACVTVAAWGVVRLRDSLSQKRTRRGLTENPIPREDGLPARRWLLDSVLARLLL